MRVHETSRLLARAPRTPCGWEWFRDTVVENQRGNVGRKFVTGKERGLTISASFALPEKGLSRFFAALLAQITGDAQATGQGHRGPHPIIPLACCRVVQGEMPRLFLTKVHNASICACVRCKLWMRRSLTAPACAPAISNQCKTRSGFTPFTLAMPRRRWRSANLPMASRTSPG